MRLTKVFLLLIFLFTAACKQATVLQPADIVLINGGIYTVDPERRWAEAAAIRDGDIIAVGANAAIRSYIGGDTRVIDLRGRMAMPGIHDSHLHPLEGGYDQIGCSLWDYQENVDQVVTALRDCAARSDGEWFTATGLDLALFGLHGPDNVLLDGIAPGRFIFVDGADGHAALVNDKVLALAGINENTPSPKGGVIERRDGSNVPNGTLRETARDIVVNLQPPRELERSTEAMRHAVRLMNSYGITSVIDAWIGELEMAVYQSLYRSGELNLRVLGAITDEGVFEKQAGDELERIIRERHKYESDLVSYNSIKFYVDGVFEGETGYLLSPYNSEPHRGAPNLTAEKLRDRVQRYYNMGLQLHFHTMGDGAVRITLDALEFAREQGDPALLKQRHTLAHLGLIDPADIPRFAELNTAANFTPVWATPDEWMMALEIPALGQERVDHMYPIRSVHEAGARVVAGSDWNYGDLDPLLSIETAITRQDPNGPSEFAGNTSEAVDLATIIDAYTINGAWLAGNDDKVGSIEVGKRADIVIYDQNLFAIEPELISDARVDVTMFDGRIVYERPEQATDQ
jgi:predicted amidohydrolase YtcJ